MQLKAHLPSQTWTVGNIQFPIKLTPGMRTREITLYFHLSGTKDVADTLDGQLFARAVALIQIPPYRIIDGWHLQEVNHELNGRVVDDPTDIGAGAGVWTMDFELVIPFRNPKQPASDDGSIPNELLNAVGCIDVTMAAAAVWGVGTITTTAGTIYGEVEQVHETNVPQLTEMGTYKPGSPDWVMPKGVYLFLFACDSATVPGTWTEAELSTVMLDVDGATVIPNLTHQQMVRSYNQHAVVDSAAELVPGTAVRMPLIWQDRHGKANISKQPAAEEGLKGRFTGTVTAPTLVYWRAIEKDASSIASIAKATNAPADAADYEPATVSKAPIRALARATPGQTPKKARLLTRVLPGKVRAAGALNFFMKR